MSNTRRITEVWEAEIQLPITATSETMEHLRDELRQTMEIAAHSAVPDPFVWHIQGALCTIRTQGDPFRLFDLGRRLFEVLPRTPKSFSVSAIRTEPIRATIWWTGYAPE